MDRGFGQSRYEESNCFIGINESEALVTAVGVSNSKASTALVPWAETQRAKKGKCTVLPCVSKHNKSAAGLKARMSRTFFFIIISLCLLFSLHILSSICSLLLYPAWANPPPLRIHKASSYLFTCFLAAFLLLFSPCPICCAGGSPSWKTLLGLFRVSPFRRETHGSPAPFLSSGGIRRNWFVLLCLSSLLLPPLSSSRPPPLLLSLPSLQGGGEGGRQVPACINTLD